MNKCKLCKRLDEKFLIKGERCSTHKCSALKKAAFSHKKPKSEYGQQLNEKQKMKLVYSLREKQFKNYVMKAINRPDKDVSEYLMQLLENRLDNIVYRLGFAASRGAARQTVSHGHILVNGRKVNIPSYQAGVGDKISIKENSAAKKNFENLNLTLKKYETPKWLKLDKEKKEGEVLNNPGGEENEFKINTASIIEFYLK